MEPLGRGVEREQRSHQARPRSPAAGGASRAMSDVVCQGACGEFRPVRAAAVVRDGPTDPVSARDVCAVRSQPHACLASPSHRSGLPRRRPDGVAGRRACADDAAVGRALRHSAARRCRRRRCRWSCRRSAAPSPDLAWRADQPVNPASVMKLVHHLRGARPARAGMDLVDAGVVARQRAEPRRRRGARREPRDQGQWRPEARAGAPLVAAAAGAAGRRARHPRRHRARPQRVQRSRVLAWRFRRRTAAAVQRAARRAAAELQVAAAQVHARRGARRGECRVRPSAGGDAGRRLGAARRRRLRELACRAQGRRQRPGSHPFSGQLSRSLRRDALAAGLRRSWELQRAPHRGAVARVGRHAQRQRARRQRTGHPGELRVQLAAAGRRGARHQQVQQQPDGAAALPHARTAAEGGGFGRRGARGARSAGCATSSASAPRR